MTEQETFQRTKRAEEALAFAREQVRNLVENHPDYFPLFTEGGLWLHDKDLWANWGEGFLCGMMWIFAKDAKDSYWYRKAEHYSRLIEHRKHDREAHDLGFIFWPSWKRWYDATGEGWINDVVIEAGKTMGLRFNERGRYLRSWVSPGSTFVDIMMNVNVIFYAAQQTGDEELYRRAFEHCLTTRRYLVRGDGSTVHEGIFDTDSGEFLRQSTHQGWRGDSSWARGMAWALYGFGTAYEFTMDKRFLDTAERCAAFYMSRTPEHGVPPNDWEEPAPEMPYESSAAATAAAGLLRLAELSENSARSEKYRRYALKILNTLCTPEFLAIETAGWEGILKHAIYHRRNRLGVDESVMWGDYYFVEALDVVNGDRA